MAYRTELGDAVRAALGTRRYREVSAACERIGKPRGITISPSYITELVQGRVPKPGVLEVLAEALGVESEPLLIAAGYREPWDPDPYLMAGIRRIFEETGVDFQLNAHEISLPHETREQVDAILAQFRERAVAWAAANTPEPPRPSSSGKARRARRGNGSAGCAAAVAW